MLKMKKIILFLSSLIGLKTNCDRYEQKFHEHYNFFNISDVRNAQPNGYLVRFSFYMVGVDDFNVVFTTSDQRTSSLSQDDAYEAGKRIWFDFLTHVLSQSEKTSKSMLRRVFL